MKRESLPSSRVALTRETGNMKSKSTIASISLGMILVCQVILTHSAPIESWSRAERAASNVKEFEYFSSRVIQMASILNGISLINEIKEGSNGTSLAQLMGVDTTSFDEIAKINVTAFSEYAAYYDGLAVSQFQNLISPKFFSKRLGLKEGWEKLGNVFNPTENDFEQLTYVSNANDGLLRLIGINLDPHITSLQTTDRTQIEAVKDAVGKLKSITDILKLSLDHANSVPAVERFKYIGGFYDLIDMYKDADEDTFKAMSTAQEGSEKLVFLHPEKMLGVASAVGIHAIVRRFPNAVPKNNETIAFMGRFESLKNLGNIGKKNWVKNIFGLENHLKEVGKLGKLYGPMKMIDKQYKQLFDAQNINLWSVDESVKLSPHIKNSVGANGLYDSVKTSLLNCTPPSSQLDLGSVKGAIETFEKVLENTQKLFETFTDDVASRFERLTISEDNSLYPKLAEILRKVKEAIEDIKFYSTPSALVNAYSELSTKKYLIMSFSNHQEVREYTKVFNCIKGVGDDLRTVGAAATAIKRISYFPNAGQLVAETQEIVAMIKNISGSISEIESIRNEIKQSKSGKELAKFKNIRNHLRPIKEAVEGVYAIRKVMDAKPAFTAFLNERGQYVQDYCANKQGSPCDMWGDYNEAKTKVANFLATFNGKISSLPARAGNSFEHYAPQFLHLKGLGNHTDELKFDDKYVVVRSLAFSAPPTTPLITDIKLFEPEVKSLKNLDLEFSKFDTQLDSAFGKLKEALEQVGGGFSRNESITTESPVTPGSGEDKSSNVVIICIVVGVILLVVLAAVGGFIYYKKKKEKKGEKIGKIGNVFKKKGKTGSGSGSESKDVSGEGPADKKPDGSKEPSKEPADDPLKDPKKSAEPAVDPLKEKEPKKSTEPVGPPVEFQSPLPESPASPAPPPAV